MDTFGRCCPLWNVDLISTSIVAILLSCSKKLNGKKKKENVKDWNEEITAIVWSRLSWAVRYLQSFPLAHCEVKCDYATSGANTRNMQSFERHHAHELKVNSILDILISLAKYSSALVKWEMKELSIVSKVHRHQEENLTFWKPLI